jgi:hypothetical protein
MMFGDEEIAAETTLDMRESNAILQEGLEQSNYRQGVDKGQRDG